MLARLVVVATLLTAIPARGDAVGTCDPAEAATLRKLLANEARKADRWNLAWRLTFTTAAVGSGALGVIDPIPSLQIGLYGSAGKATIGALARWIMPLHVDVPASTDTCTDITLLRAEIWRVGKLERNLFWTGHIGGTLVNLGGAAYVWKYDTLGKALVSIAVGYPVGLLSTYTMPRNVWHAYRERTWTLPVVTVVPHDDGWVLSASGVF